MPQPPLKSRYYAGRSAVINFGVKRHSKTVMAPITPLWKLQQSLIVHNRYRNEIVDGLSIHIAFPKHVLVSYLLSLSHSHSLSLSVFILSIYACGRVCMWVRVHCARACVYMYYVCTCIIFYLQSTYSCWYGRYRDIRHSAHQSLGRSRDHNLLQGWYWSGGAFRSWWRHRLYERKLWGRFNRAA